MIIDILNTVSKQNIIDIQQQLAAVTSDPSIRFISELIWDIKEQKLISRTRIVKKKL